MLCQYDTVAEELIANPFPVDQVGMVIGRLQYDLQCNYGIYNVITVFTM